MAGTGAGVQAVTVAMARVAATIASVAILAMGFALDVCTVCQSDGPLGLVVVIGMALDVRQAVRMMSLGCSRRSTAVSCYGQSVLPAVGNGSKGYPSRWCWLKSS